ncbi:MAG: 50S ribosomal protein L23 [Bdellovibrionales bacterium]|nr:50S ribosomal protein L23 [Bdellovibrionales bacterium]
MYYTIKKPLITEKNSLLAESGVYVFEVDRKSTKTEVKDAVEKLFRVKVETVRTAICRGRSRKTRLGVSKVRYWKKAMVKLMPGEKIKLFEGA